MEKPSLFGIDSPMSSNFLYRRPALESSSHPHSIIHGGGGGSTRGPIGFYYEDDAPYEQHSSAAAASFQTLGNSTAGAAVSPHEIKSMYLGADTLNGDGSTDGTDTSDEPQRREENKSSLQPLVEFVHSREATIDQTTRQQLRPQQQQQNSTIKDLDQRLKHVQQHMYRRSNGSTEH